MTCTPKNIYSMASYVALVAGNQNFHYYNDDMSAASVPAPIKILCLLALGLFIWLMGDSDNNTDQNGVTNGQVPVVDPAPSIDNNSNGDLQRETKSAAVDEGTSVIIPLQHQAPIARGLYQNIFGEPIGGAVVELWRFNQTGMGIVNSLPRLSAPEFITITDAAGEFELPFSRLSSRQPQLGLLANGDEYILLLRHSNYADLREMSLTSFDKQLIVTAPRQLPLLKGQVLLHDNSPAAVTGIFVDGTVKTWADADGNFSVSLSKDSHNFYFNHRLGATSKVISGGQHLETIIVLPPAQNISGVIHDFNNQPLADVEIEAVRKSTTEASGRASSRATSDSEGRFVLHGLADGEFHLRAVRPPREYWARTVLASTQDVQLKIDYQVFSFDVASAPPYALWNNLVVRAERNGNYRTLVSESKSSVLQPHYEYFLEDDVEADRIIIDFQVSGYQPLHIIFEVDPSAPRQNQSAALVPDSQSAALQLSFLMPRDIQPFELSYGLQNVADGEIVQPYRRTITSSVNERREYYYPDLSAGDYKVLLQIEGNSFFNLPEIKIAGNAIIKIEPDENNFIELELVAK